MSRQVRSVAVVGGGVSGVAAAAHLKAAGLDVTLFERASVAGGVWVLDHRQPLEPSYPSVKPSLAEVTPNRPCESWRDLLDTKFREYCDCSILHSPPGPAYEGLCNNVPTPLLELKLNSWKPGTKPIVKHHVLAEYIQETARKAGVDERTLYNTRVEHVSKKREKWHVQTTTLQDGFSKEKTKFWEFDFLVLATGHYNACKVPETSGLREWKLAWPDRVQHSKSYRNPTKYTGKTLLLIGASVSSTDIAKELGPVAKQIYQTSRGGLFDLHPTLLPDNAIRVGEVASFNLPKGMKEMLSNISERGIHYSDFSLGEHEPLPFTITLVDGTTLENIDMIILCTGYQFSFPFLKELHRDDQTGEQVDQVTLVTDGTQMHNLHQDIFYIPDPTLAFVGVPFHVATFTLYEFQAIAVATVFSGKAELPSQDEMRDEYQSRVQRKGFGKAFHSLKGQDVEYANSLLEWINRGRRIAGESLIEGHTAAWHAEAKEFRRLVARRFSGDDGIAKNDLPSSSPEG